MKSRRAVALAAIAATAVTLLMPTHATAARPASHPARVVTITIPARHAKIAPRWYGYSGAPRADVLLPAGFNPQKAYPLVLLLHGLGCNYSWYAQWKLTSLFAKTGAIVVTPEGGNGWYTDWYDGGKRNDPQWETYDLDDVLPAILHRYRIRPQRRYHAIVGISMGGLGASYLGGRLPGFFGTMASLSGFVDLGYHTQVTEPAMGFLADDTKQVDAVDGPPNGFYLKGHDPSRLAVNLRHTRVFLSTGNGAISKQGLKQPTYGGVNAIPEGTAAEGAVIYPMTVGYHRALLAAAVHSTYHVFPGGHDLADFAHELKVLLGWGLFKPVGSHPTHWTNKTVATHGDLWGIHYRFARAPRHVVTFHRSGDRLSISAAGAAVTLRLVDGRVVRTKTPATVRLRRGD